MVTSNIGGASVWNMDQVTLLAPRILRQCLDFKKQGLSMELGSSDPSGTQNFEAALGF